MKKELCVLVVCAVGGAKASNHQLSLPEALQKGDEKLVEDVLKTTPLPVLRKQAASCQPPLLIAALEKRWIEVFKTASKNFICPYQRDSTGWQAIHHAAQTQNSTYLKILLKDGHDNVDTPTENHLLTRASNRYHTPLFFAVCEGRSEAVKLLLEKKASLVKTDTGLSLVQLARQKKEGANGVRKDHYAECEQLLLDYGDRERQEQGCTIS